MESFIPLAKPGPLWKRISCHMMMACPCLLIRMDKEFNSAFNGARKVRPRSSITFRILWKPYKSGENFYDIDHSAGDRHHHCHSTGRTLSRDRRYGQTRRPLTGDHE